MILSEDVKEREKAWELVEALEDEGCELEAFGNTYLMRKKNDRKIARSLTDYLGLKETKLGDVGASLDRILNNTLSQQRDYDIVLAEEGIYTFSEEAENDVDRLNVSVETTNPNYYGALTNL